MNYTLILNGLVIRRFDTPEQRETFVSELIWDWLDKGEAYYQTNGVVLVDSQTREKACLEYGAEEE